MIRLLTLLACAALLSGCVAGYTLVQPNTVAVAQGAMKVQPSMAWNKMPKSALDIAHEENWTQNGPILDVIQPIGRGATIALNGSNASPWSFFEVS